MQWQLCAAMDVNARSRCSLPHLQIVR